MMLYNSSLPSSSSLLSRNETFRKLIASSRKRLKSSARKPGSSNISRSKSIVMIEVFNVCRAGKYRHLFVDLRIDRRCHRIESLNDLVIAHRACTALGKHRCCERGKSFFARWIECRTGHEQNAKSHQRRRAGQKDGGDFRGESC